MSKNKIIFILALLIALLPHTGFPRSWSSVLFTLFGLAIAGLSLHRHDQSANFFSHQAYEKDEQAELADARAFVAEEIVRDERAEEGGGTAEEILSATEGSAEVKTSAYDGPPRRRARQTVKRIKKEKNAGEQNVSPEEPAPSSAVSSETAGERSDEGSV